VIRLLLAGLLARRLAGLALWLALRPGGWAVIVAATLIWLKATA
jgi:hypothetical protein